MLKLGGFALSNYYNKVKIALIEKGVPFEEEYANVSQEPSLLARSPMGKIPFLDLGNGQTLCESSVILEYLDDAYPDKPLYPRDALARARVRELIVMLDLHLELVARRLYPEAFFGGQVSEGTKTDAAKDLAKGARAFKQLAKFAPFVAGPAFTAADCSAAVQLQLVSLTTKTIYGQDLFRDDEVLKGYVKMMRERPSVKRVNDDLKAYVAAQKKG
jgi:glutathione S-transferase